MQVTREELNPCTIQLKVVCGPDQVRAGFNKAYKSLSKSIKLPGFRPGTAPRSVLEKHVPKEQIAEDAVDNVVRTALMEAIKAQSIQPDPSTAPSVDLDKFEQDAEVLEFTAKIPLPAQVELGEYVGLPIEKPSLEVSEEEVEYQVEELRRRRSTREAVTDRGVQDGDVAVVNFKVEGGLPEGRNFMVVAGQTFAELDEALRGMKAEELKAVELKFPENFQEKDWAGKKHKATIQVNSLSSVKLPELDDDFAKALKTDSVSDLKDKMRDSIWAAKEQMLAEIVNEQLFEKLLERSKVEVSDNMWENLAAQRIREYAQEQGKQGKSLEQYAKDNGMSVEQFIEAQRGNAKGSVVKALLIKEIFIKEKMSVTNGDLNDALRSMASEYEISPEEMLALIQKNQAFQELQFRAMAKKVGDFLASQANVGEASESKSKAAPKKKAEPAEAKPKAPAKKSSSK